MDVQGHCMAVAILQAKSMLVNLEAQVGRHLLEENSGLHFAMLESCEGAISNSFSLPGFSHCPSIPLWLELQLTQHTFSSEQTHSLMTIKCGWERLTLNRNTFHLCPYKSHCKARISSVLTSRARWQASKTLWPRLLTRWDLTWN